MILYPIVIIKKYYLNQNYEKIKKYIKTGDLLEALSLKKEVHLE